ncbi:MAG: Autotransporter-associated beta strand repeat protein [Candidatus Gottesmanbacteria bacterium GW2011_GWB1_49_7]|uniref:Autotransporter-associated beta strand repeat protein n=1 Tax=Candidatus Gottesmanbacteria bacterium GW2011_GWB1_49_7 TaxID=1618448 RepID=A0A0G1W3T5_9BACT|nr:MAG: Autotransporter-associated beta strand repeat protein [Candidatus Gottesmanbacteria bacterium GW2011_GWB1_49_7]
MAIARTLDVRRHLLALSAEITATATALGLTEVALLSRYLRTAQAELERRCRTLFESKVIKSKPEATLVKGTDYDLEESGYDYDRKNMAHNRVIQLFHRPVTSLDRIRLVYGKGPGTVIATYTTNWCEVDKWSGMVIIRNEYEATWGAIIAEAFSWVPWGAKAADTVANLLCIDYTAGLDLAVVEGSLASVTVTAGGSGYTSAPTVAFSGGGGSGAAGTATIAGGAVAAIALTAVGSGYTSAPTVALTGGAGANATATAVLATDWPEDGYEDLRDVVAMEAARRALPDLKQQWLATNGLTGLQSTSLSTEAATESRSYSAGYFDDEIKRLQALVDNGVAAWVLGQVPYAMTVV